MNNFGGFFCYIEKTKKGASGTCIRSLRWESSHYGLLLEKTKIIKNIFVIFSKKRKKEKKEKKKIILQ